MTKEYDSSTKVIVLRCALDDASARKFVDRKKHTAFGSPLSRPKNDIHIQALEMSYECLRTVSGSYTADYLRNAIHTLKVNKSVHSVIIGNATFNVQQKSRIASALSVRRGSANIDVTLKEHVHTDTSLSLTFDIDGTLTHAPKYKIKPDTVEINPDEILDNAATVKEQKLDRADAVAILEKHLKSPLEDDIEDLNERFVLHHVEELYVPIFEARLSGPRNKIAVMRIDGARKKII